MATVSEFASRIKAKYPQYQGVADEDLARRIVDKYPQYKDSVEFAPAPEAEPIANPGNTKPEVSTQQTLSGLIRGTRPEQDTSTLAALSPRRAQAEREGAGPLRHFAASAADIGANALGVPYAVVETLAGPEERRSTLLGGKGSLKSNLLNREGSIIKGIANDPASPSMLINPVGGGLRGLTAAGLKQGAASALGHQADNIARGKDVSVGSAAAETALSGGLPGLLKGGAKVVRGLGAGLKNAVSRLSDIPEEALKEGADPKRLEQLKQVVQQTGGDQTQLADRAMGAIQGLRAADDQAATAVQGLRQRGLERQLLEVRRGKGTLEDVSAFDAGKKIESAAQGAMKAEGARFGQVQDELLVNRGLGKKGVEFTGNQNQFEEVVDDFLKEAGVGQGGKQYGVIGNVSVPEGAINAIRGMKETFKTALTTRDMLDQLRLVDNKIDFGGADNGRLFARGSQEDLAVKDLRHRLGGALEEQIGRAAGKSRDEVLELWRSHRQSFANTSRAIETIQDGLGAGKVNTEAYFAKIKEIGIEDLREIRGMAKQNPDMMKVWNELENGFFDNILKKGVKEGKMDYEAISKFWNGMDADLKQTMLPPKVIARVNEVLARTTPFEFAPTHLGGEVAGGAHGALSEKVALRNIENIGTKDKRTALQDLRLLDDILGLEGGDRFSTQAMDAFRGKQLQIQPDGRLPMLSNAKTGKSIAGLSYGELLGGGVGAGVGALTGGALGTVAGGALGKYAGQIAGAYAQSPAGALAAYRILMNMEEPVKSGIAAAERSLPRASAALRSGLFQPERER